jgi:phospholipid N-methyltransferase
MAWSLIATITANGIGNSYMKTESKINVLRASRVSAETMTRAGVNKQESPDRVGGNEGVWLFARNFFRHPRMLGSIVPSSRFLIKHLLAPIDWAQAHTIVEYGPGIGVITAEILRRMRPDASLIVVETNPHFVSFLTRTVKDKRLHVIEASAESIVEILQQHGYEKASYVISGIPFSTIPAPARERILRKTCSILEPCGLFLVYQFSSRVLKDLRRIFRYVSRQFELFNVLPAHLFFCRPDLAPPTK